MLKSYEDLQMCGTHYCASTFLTASENAYTAKAWQLISATMSQREVAPQPS